MGKDIVNEAMDETGIYIRQLNLPKSLAVTDEERAALNLATQTEMYFIL